METCNTPLADAESIDILVFNDDRMQKLDTYQRFDMSACSSVKVGSTAGDKTIAVIVNSRVDRYYWAGVTSRNDMKNICFNLEDETRDNPSMSGEYRILYNLRLILVPACKAVVALCIGGFGSGGTAVAYGVIGSNALLL